MGSCMSNNSTLLTRGNVIIVFSTTSGTSKNTAAKLQEVLEDNKFTVSVINIGDYDYKELISSEGPIIFLLSTYGDGDSPSDGEAFYKWVITKQNHREAVFKKLRYAILAFGNSSFENHCGFGLKTEKFLKFGGAEQLFQLTKCDSASKDNNVNVKFSKWSRSLIEVLNKTYELKQISRNSNNKSYIATFSSQPGYKWQQQALKKKNLGTQMSNYLHMPIGKIVYIKQLRKKVEDERSTLQVRIQINKTIDIWPACNVEIFPMNQVSPQEHDDSLVSYNQVNSKVPFPKMPLKQIKKILNYRQNASNNQIKSALLLSTSSKQAIQSYNKQLRQKTEIKVTCGKLINDLKPSAQFLPEVGVNNVRTYTLSSWDSEHTYLDLCISLVKGGLTSEYLKTHPQEVRFRTIKSSFYVPEDRPIVMIANGSGIAPFRSIAQFAASLPSSKRPSLRLYYGIQSSEVDFYFGEEWRKLQQQKIVDIRLAESRRDPSKKEYIQNLLEKDVAWLTQHLTSKNGVLFVCGGESMSKQVNKIIITALNAYTKQPSKSIELSAQLKKNKTIVEQVFG